MVNFNEALLGALENPTALDGFVWARISSLDPLRVRKFGEDHDLPLSGNAEPEWKLGVGKRVILQQSGTYLLLLKVVDEDKSGDDEGDDGSVYIQTDPPPASAQNSNTLWIDLTDGENVPKMWDGSAWVSILSKAIIDASNKADAAELVANSAETKAQTAIDDAYAATTAVQLVDQKADTIGSNLADVDGRVSDLRDNVIPPIEAAAAAAVVDFENQYALSSSETTAPTTGWSTTPPERTPGNFIWVRTHITYGDNTTTVTPPSLQTGNAGADGLPGAPGVGLVSTTIDYAQSTSDTTPPTSGWSTSVPTLIKGRYLWTRSVWTYTDDSTETGYSVAYVPQDGSDGNDGLPGAPGVGISSTAISYAQSSNGTTPPSSGWGSQPPSPVAGRYIWTRTIWTYTDSSTETGYSVGKIGDTGAKGDKGDEGAQGVGVASVTSFFRLTTGAAPARPTTLEPSGWSETEPGYQAGRVLWRVERVVYTDNSFSYTLVSRVSSYDAAAEARAVAITADRRVQAHTRAPVAADGADAPVNALWHQYGGSPQSLVQTWRWTGTAWIEAPMDPVAIPKIDIGSGTFGDLSGLRLEARTVLADALAVSHIDNLIPNGAGEMGGLYGWAHRTNILWQTTGLPPDAGVSGKFACVKGNTVISPGSAIYAFDVVPGREYVFEVWLRADVAGSRMYLECRDTEDAAHAVETIRTLDGHLNPGGGHYLINNVVVPSSWQKYGKVVTFTAPRVYLASLYWNHSAGSSRDAVQQIAGMRLRPRVNGVLIEDNSIKAPHLAVDALDYKVAVGMHHRAATILGGEIVSTAEPDNPDAANIQMRDARLTVNQPTIDGPQVTTSLGKTDEDDQLALYELGNPNPGVLLSASGHGGVSGQFSVGERLTVAGRNILNELDAGSGRVLVRARNTGNSGKAGASALGLVRMNVDMETGRLYDVTLNGVAYGPHGSQIVIELRQVSGGGQAMYNSPVVARYYVPTNASGVAADVTLTAHTSGTGPQSLLWTITGTASSPAWMAGASVMPWEARVIDMGVNQFAGSVSWGGAGGTPAETMPPQPPDEKQRIVKIYQATAVRSWRGSGTISGQLSHGYWGGFQRYSQILFPSTVTTDLSGASNISAELLLANQHTWNRRSMTVRILPSTNTSLRSSPLTTTGQAVTWEHGDRSYHPISGWAASHRSINLGGGAGTGTGAYGYFSDRLQDCLLKLTYDK